jgi:KUP system potassium uptake protein
MSSGSSKSLSHTAALAFLALGVVFGDIGTSPLYALKETFNPHYGIPLTMEAILGGCSSIFWALMLIVMLKYMTVILRATNKGEGGVMAMLALASSVVRPNSRRRKIVIGLGLLGAALFYGEAVITPAMSVLSAVEGLEIGSVGFKSYTVLISVVIIISLFSCQRYGTAFIGRYFGLVCSIWFAAIALVGAFNIVQCPRILMALNPYYAFTFLTTHGIASFLVLGSVLLAFTGAEALYADVGHFGRKAIRVAWFMVFPALILNYFGQGALLMRDPSALTNPFYLACPGWALYPMIGLATLATIIASQAVISGAYSVTWQAIQLHFLPRMQVLHTSDRMMGQIYIPAVNWMLLLAVLVTMITFGTSARLAAAYGISVAGTMLTSTLLVSFVIRYDWKFPLWLTLSIVIFFASIDGVFFASSFLKIFHGAWFTLALGFLSLIVMKTWNRGREIVVMRRKEYCSENLPNFLRLLLQSPPHRVPGTAVFFCQFSENVPSALTHNLKHNKVLHAHVVFLTLSKESVPRIAERDRWEMTQLEENCYRLIIKFGFHEEFNVPTVLKSCAQQGYEFLNDQLSYFLNDERLVINHHTKYMMLWRKILFIILVATQKNAAEHYHLPSNQVIRLASHIEI